MTHDMVAGSGVFGVSKLVNCDGIELEYQYPTCTTDVVSFVTVCKVTHCM